MFHGYKLGQKITDDNDDLHRGQRSTEVKCGNLCYIATTFGQMYRVCKLRMMMTFMKVKGHPKVIKGQLIMPYGF